jgi:hypothetical protein
MPAIPRWVARPRGTGRWRRGADLTDDDPRRSPSGALLDEVPEISLVPSRPCCRVWSATQIRVSRALSPCERCGPLSEAKVLAAEAWEDVPRPLVGSRFVCGTVKPPGIGLKEDLIDVHTAAPGYDDVLVRVRASDRRLFRCLRICRRSWRRQCHDRDNTAHGTECVPDEPGHGSPLDLPGWMARGTPFPTMHGLCRGPTITPCSGPRHHTQFGLFKQPADGGGGRELGMVISNPDGCRFEVIGTDRGVPRRRV